MDDDIRSRFRGVGGRPSQNYGPMPPRPRPMAAPAQPQPRVAASQPAPARPVAPPPKPAATRPAPAPKPQRKKRRGNKGKKVFGVLLVLILLAGGAGAYAKFKPLHKEPEQAATGTEQNQTDQTPAVEQPTGSIRLIAVGDSLAFDSINDNAKQGGNYDYSSMYSEMKPFFDKADIGVCTETTIGAGESFGISGYPAFNAPTTWQTGFADLGCNVMNLATDHINDKGDKAIKAARDDWDKRKDVQAVAGANRSEKEQNTVNYFEVKGVKFAFLAYTTKSQKKPAPAYTVNSYSAALAKKQIEEARKNAQFVIVAMTWGQEDANNVSDEQKRIAKELAAANADVIIGNGPHVLQGTEVLEGTNSHQSLVWYSLGNFLNSQLPVSNLIGGMAIMDISVANQSISDPKLLPIYMHYEWTAAEKSANKVDARHNFKLYPLDAAASVLAKSQNGTTVKAQTDRVKAIITKSAPIKVITSKEFDK